MLTLFKNQLFINFKLIQPAVINGLDINQHLLIKIDYHEKFTII
jgi:hypothetical protein